MHVTLLLRTMYLGLWLDNIIAVKLVETNGLLKITPRIYKRQLTEYEVLFKHVLP